MTETPGSYAGENIPQPSHRLSRVEQMSLLMWHLLFTGKCPRCGEAMLRLMSLLNSSIVGAVKRMLLDSQSKRHRVNLWVYSEVTLQADLRRVAASGHRDLDEEARQADSRMAAEAQ
ncbi:hypothetical protein H6F76_02665 [Leptolyngbya sp. FACHB-321]|uniref:hypothetical protein n=1 Tax=Leptolyngbya sp. FACHB-321 TaxID=2692807 RepID=UPI001681F2CE|nr:hypothetical protein [Leptolyngbya sp. FACHB-321]MBD2033952.1 hypothetical protein [Leptolyngbya sp. FACHB-321]